MPSPDAKVIPSEAGDATHAGTTDVGSTKGSDVTPAETAHVTSTEAAHVTATKTTTVAAATAAASLCARGNEAAGKQRSRQHQHHSSSHDLSPFGWADVPP
jgi:hypothetical protein